MSNGKFADFFARLDHRMAEHRRRMAEKDAEIGAQIASRRAQQSVPASAPQRVTATPAEGIEAQARREYDLSAALPAEFGNVETYIAFRRAEAGGRIKVFGVPRS